MFRNVPKGSDRFRNVPMFRKVPKGSERFREVPKVAKGFQKVLKGSKRFRKVLKVHKGTDRFQSDYYGNEVDRMFFPRERHI